MIIRTPKGSERPYVATARSTAQDETLSWEARGVLWYLLSKPDDWEVSAANLCQGCGRDKVYKILRELLAHGYLVREAVRESGRYVDTKYTVYETPVSTENEKPDTEIPEAVEATLHNKEYKHNRESTVITSGKSEKTLVDDAGSLYRVYEQEVGVLSPFVADSLKDMEGEYGSTLVIDAIREASMNNKRSIRYIEAILRNWSTAGRVNRIKKMADPLD
jgi:DnaD/phage-associated family protein